MLNFVVNSKCNLKLQHGRCIYTAFQTGIMETRNYLTPEKTLIYNKFFWVFYSDIQWQTVSNGSEWESSQEYLVNAGILKGSIPDPTFLLLYINDLLDDFICNIDIYVDDTALFSKLDKTSDLWQRLQLASEIESDLRDTVHCGAGRDLLISMLEKLRLFCLIRLIPLVPLMWIRTALKLPPWEL